MIRRSTTHVQAQQVDARSPPHLSSFHPNNTYSMSLSRVVYYILALIFGIYLTLALEHQHCVLNHISKSIRFCKQSPPKWHPGLFHIHHLFLGPLVSSFMILPDGTTVLIDLGDQQAAKRNIHGSKKCCVEPNYPNDSPLNDRLKFVLRSLGPDPKNLSIDYYVVTHYHADHVGGLRLSLDKNKKADRSAYEPGGIAKIAEVLPPRILLDRGTQHPPGGLEYHDKHGKTLAPSFTFLQYNNFRSHMQNTPGVNVNELHACNSSQIIPLRNTSFPLRVKVTTVKVNNLICGRESNTVLEIPGLSTTLSENLLSTGLVFEYGNFRYANGADNEKTATNLTSGEKGPIVDTAIPFAKATGKVDIMTALHHAFGDGMSDEVLNILNPKVIILQGWHIHHPPTKEIAARMIDGGKTVYSTAMFKETKKSLGKIGKQFASTRGHVMVHVEPLEDGKAQKYEIITLDGEMKVKTRKSFLAHPKTD